MTLSDRIAALDAPHRGAELWIAKAIGANGVWECKPFAFHSEYTKPYLSSIDAAMTLIPEGCYPKFSKVSENEWHVHLGFANRAVGIVAKAHTLAIAICVAALRERGL